MVSKYINKILMADDDSDDCFLAEESLREIGLESVLSTVGDGIELLRYLAENPAPDLILLDLNMPLKDGREVLRDIKSDPVLCNIPVIVLTTSHQEEDRSFTLKAGANQFLTKPPEFKDWVEMMKSIVSGTIK